MTAVPIEKIEWTCIINKCFCDRATVKINNFTKNEDVKICNIFVNAGYRYLYQYKHICIAFITEKIKQ